MPDQQMLGLACSGRYFTVAGAKASLMSTLLILLTSGCSDPTVQILQGAVLTSNIVTAEHAPVFIIQENPK